MFNSLRRLHFTSLQRPLGVSDPLQTFMSGIAGIFSAIVNPRTRETLSLMLKCMESKRDHLSGQVAQAPAVAGWVSQPGTPTAVMPVWNRDHTVALIFSGEEFQFLNGGGSLEQFLEVYDRLGPRCLEQLNGWFCGVLIDVRAQTATLFNDRYGMGRVYYRETPDSFSFASEAKSLLAVHPQTRELNQQGLAEYMSVGCVLQNRSLYKNIYLLPPASAWTFHHDGKLTKTRYFDPATWEQQERLSPEAYSEQLRDVFSRVVPRYFAGPQRTALSLTGGLDSRMVLAWAKPSPGTLPCYTFGGPYRDCADVTIARELARVTQQAHTVLPIDDSFFQNFAELATETIRVSDGTMDISGAVELYMNRKAVGIAPVRITGNYGSEILRANIAFRPRKLDRSLYTPGFSQLIDGAEETYRTEAVGHRLSFIATKQVPWHHYSRYSVEKAVLTPRSPFLDNDVVALAYRAPQIVEGSAAPLLRLISDGNSVIGRTASDRALRHGRSTLIAPLLRHWQEFTAKAEYAYDYGMPGWLVRSDRIVSKLALERWFLGRHKFYHFRTWYCGQLSRFLRDLLTNNSEDGTFRGGAVNALVEEHAARRANHTLDLHRAASLALIRKSTQIV